jgi:hypothetical protein
MAQLAHPITLKIPNEFFKKHEAPCHKAGNGIESVAAETTPD